MIVKHVFVLQCCHVIWVHQCTNLHVIFFTLLLFYIFYLLNFIKIKAENVLDAIEIYIVSIAHAPIWLIVEGTGQ